ASAAGGRAPPNPRAQFVPLLRPMLTQMYVGGVMACTHAHAPPSKPISPMCPSAVHKCTLKLPILLVGRLLESLARLSDRGGPPVTICRPARSGAGSPSFASTAFRQN